MGLRGAGAEEGGAAPGQTGNAHPSMFVLHNGEEQLSSLGPQLPEMRLRVDHFPVLEQWWDTDSWEQLTTGAIASTEVSATASAAEVAPPSWDEHRPFPLYSQTEIYDGSAALYQLVNDAYRADDDVGGAKLDRCGGSPGHAGGAGTAKVDHLREVDPGAEVFGNRGGNEHRRLAK